MKRNSFILMVMVAATTILASCGNDFERKPGRIYAPDMTYSRAYEYYGTNEYAANKLVAQAPVNGTIPRGGYAPYRIAEGDTTAAKANTCSIELKSTDIEEGKRIYAIHCGVCHGNNLDGNGPLYASGKFAAAPANFKDPKYLNMTVGTMYHAIMYGKNLMGSYASQLDVKQRWMILAYIKKVQSENGGAPFTQFKINDGASTTGTVNKAPQDLKPGETTKVLMENKNGTRDTIEIQLAEQTSKAEAKGNPITDLKAASKK